MFKPDSRNKGVSRLQICFGLLLMKGLPNLTTLVSNGGGTPNLTSLNGFDLLKWI